MCVAHKTHRYTTQELDPFGLNTLILDVSTHITAYKKNSGTSINCTEECQHHSYILIIKLTRWHIPIAVYTALDSWWWTENLSETCRVLFQKLIWEISASRWFYHKNISHICTVLWVSKVSIVSKISMFFIFLAVTIYFWHFTFSTVHINWMCWFCMPLCLRENGDLLLKHVGGLMFMDDVWFFILYKLCASIGVYGWL